MRALDAVRLRPPSALARYLELEGFPLPVLVGEANPYWARGAPEWSAPLAPWPPNSSGARLVALLGWSRLEYLRSFARRNLFDAPPRRWSAPAARERARALVRECGLGREYVLLGARVAAAFRDLEHSQPDRVNPARFTLIPHPSGRNRRWNDPQLGGRLRVELDRFRRRGAGGE